MLNHNKSNTTSGKEKSCQYLSNYFVCVFVQKPRVTIFENLFYNKETQICFLLQIHTDGVPFHMI